MKKLIIIVMIMGLGLILMNCGGSKPQAKMNDIPEWYLNPPVAEDAIYEAGDALKQSLGLAKTAADGRARDAIARAIEVKVSNLLKNFMQESGVGEDAEAIEFTSSVSKQVANTVLQGARVVKREVKNEGNSYHVYSLVEYNLNSLIQETVDAVKKQKSLYNEAKANMSFEELEKEVQGMDTTSE